MFRFLLNINTRMKVGARISAGFGLVLALVAAVAMSAFFGLDATRDGFHRYQITSHNAIRVQDIDGDFSFLRRSILVYSQSGSAQALRTMNELRASLRERIRKTAEETQEPFKKESLGRAGTLLDEYGVNLDRLVQARGARQGDRRAVDAPGRRHA
jgi:CHASE3 domain sensor protein